jgi:hypothetical protein
VIPEDDAPCAANARRDDERVVAVAHRWHALVEEFAGGDPAIGSSLDAMYRARMKQARPRVT